MKTDKEYTVTELKNHLNNCDKILQKFIKKYNINLYYLKIDDVVSIDSHSSLNLKVLNEFNDYKLSEVDKLLTNLYEEFRKYLEKNKLKYNLHIKSKHHGWAVHKIIFKFEITNE